MCPRPQRWGTASLLTVKRTHRADFQLVALERLQPHQGPDASANQDFIANVVFQDVGKLLGVACRFVGKESRVNPKAGNWCGQGGPKGEDVSSHPRDGEPPAQVISTY